MEVFFTYTYDEIVTSFKKQNITGLIGGTGEMKELAKILEDDENIRYATIAKHNNKNHLITTTNYRIIFLKKGIFKTQFVEIPIDQITQLQMETHVISATITFLYNNQLIMIEKVNRLTSKTFFESMKTQQPFEIEKAVVEPKFFKTQQNENLIKQDTNKFEDFVVKRILINAVGTKYENRDKTLLSIINKMKEDELFVFDKYGGLKNKEIIEEYYDEPVYEYYSESYPAQAIDYEPTNEFDPNAIKVLIGMDYDSLQHIGYIPKTDNTTIHDLANKYQFIMGSTIIGGKYKIVATDDNGEEKVRIINNKEYGARLTITFFEEEGTSLLAANKIFDFRGQKSTC